MKDPEKGKAAPAGTEGGKAEKGKKAENGEEGKGGEGEGGGGEGEEKTKEDFQEEKVAERDYSPKKAIIVATVSLILLVSSAVLFAKYYLHVKDFGDNVTAMRKIREFMVSRNKSLDGTNDSAILFATEELVKKVADRYQKAFQLKTTVDGILQKVKKGWEYYEGGLYYFGPVAKNFYESQKECEEEDTDLISVFSSEVESYLEAKSKMTSVGLWIGLQKVNGTWKWIDGADYSMSFWRPGQPDHLGTTPKDCAEIQANCPPKDAGNCWNDVSCDSERRPVCKIDTESVEMY